jgi:hypothetical protein
LRKRERMCDRKQESYREECRAKHDDEARKEGLSACEGSAGRLKESPRSGGVCQRTAQIGTAISHVTLKDFIPSFVTITTTASACHIAQVPWPVALSRCQATDVLFCWQGWFRSHSDTATCGPLISRNHGSSIS